VWLAAAVVVAFGLPLTVAQPYWQEIDDAAMAMVAHGYGITAAPSRALIFASVPYGTLVELAGHYGALMYAWLVLSAVAAAYALWRAGVAGPLGAAALLAVFAPAALYPQFTFVAGLLAISAALLIVTDRRWLALAAAAALLVVAALLRSEAAAFALLLTLPLWIGGRSLRAAVAGVVFVSAMASAFLVDRAYYAAPEWRQFSEMNRARLRFTDYGLSHYFFRYPLDPMRLAWTPNDLVMVGGWFFADPRVFPAGRVAELASQVYIDDFVASNLERYAEALAPFRDESLLALTLLAAFFAWRARSRAAAWTLGLIAAAMIAFWLGGRPGVGRIYYAPLAGAVLLGLATKPVAPRRHDALVIGVVLLAAAAALAARNAADRREEAQARSAICTLPKDRLYVVWGDQLPYEQLYRPLSAPGDGCLLAVYPLAVQAYAPYAVAQLRAFTGESDVVAAILAGKELDMIALGWQIDVLRRHLRIHYGRALQWRLLRGDGGRGTWYRVTVAPK
jgi:uncharacterized membrane protein